MKYMNFNNSCAYTCLSNMLEKYNIESRDIDIITESKFAYMYFADKQIYYTGDMLQSKIWFDLYLNKHHLEYIENRSTKTEFIDFLSKTKEEVMVGLSFNGCKHAVVFKSLNKKKYTFLYPHRKDDGHENYISIEKDKLETYLEDNVSYGFIQYNLSIYGPNLSLYRDSILYFRKYKCDFYIFLLNIKTMEEVVSVQDILFKPLLLTTYNMMKIIGNKTLLKTLAVLQKQFLSLVSSNKTNILMYKIFDLKLLKEAFREMEDLIKKEFNS